MAAKTPTTIPTTTHTIMFNVSPEFMEAIEAFVGHHNISRAQAIRMAVADHIGYDLESEPSRRRRTKYGSPEERKEAAKERAKRRRQLTAKLLAAYESEDTEEAIKALVASLKAVDEDDEEDVEEDDE